MTTADERLNQDLQWFNGLPADKAINVLVQCCGSSVWAQLVCEHRPFATLEKLKADASSVWRQLSAEDWREAFLSHPRIGEQQAGHKTSAQAESWSAQEQKASGTNNEATKEELRRLNREYDDKFGFIFIICASGKSSAEILEALQRRLKNDRGQEIQNAADEQEKITSLRLEKLIVNRQ